MKKPSEIENILSGTRQDLHARVLRMLLSIAEPAYAGGVWSRNRMFDRRWRKSHAVEVPVVSIGNLTTGGTGKTPLVRWLVERLRFLEYNPAIISRGYGPAAGKDGARQHNDEYWELKSYLPNVPHVQNADRVAAARQAITHYGADVIVLDDGFQHRRLRRDYDLVLIDATQPFGFGHLLPRGLLREPLGALRRADMALITRAGQIEQGELARIARQIKQFAPVVEIGNVTFRPAGFCDIQGNDWPLDHLKDRTILGFCGIGNPRGFASTLAPLCDRMIDVVQFPDHYGYVKSDLDRLIETARCGRATALVCTRKDLVKIREITLDAIPIYALAIDADLGDDESLVFERIQQALTRAN